MKTFGTDLRQKAKSFCSCQIVDSSRGRIIRPTANSGKDVPPKMFDLKHFGTIGGRIPILPATAAGAGNGCCCSATTETPA
jgi:hypothetical protein